MFAKRVKIKRVEIPDNVINIGAMMFLSCILMREVILPYGTNKISDETEESYKEAFPTFVKKFDLDNLY